MTVKMLKVHLMKKVMMKDLYLQYQATGYTVCITIFIWAIPVFE